MTLLIVTIVHNESIPTLTLDLLPTAQLPVLHMTDCYFLNIHGIKLDTFGLLSLYSNRCTPEKDIPMDKAVVPTYRDVLEQVTNPMMEEVIAPKTSSSIYSQMDNVQIINVNNNPGISKTLTNLFYFTV